MRRNEIKYFLSHLSVVTGLGSAYSHRDEDKQGQERKLINTEIMGRLKKYGKSVKINQLESLVFSYSCERQYIILQYKKLISEISCGNPIA